MNAIISISAFAILFILSMARIWSGADLQPSASGYGLAILPRDAIRGATHRRIFGTSPGRWFMDLGIDIAVVATGHSCNRAWHCNDLHLLSKTIIKHNLYLKEHTQ